MQRLRLDQFRRGAALLCAGVAEHRQVVGADGRFLAAHQVGATPLRNLFLNTGHGTLGWTMSAGSGKLLADLVTQRTPDISTEGLSIARYGQPARQAARPAQLTPRLS